MSEDAIRVGFVFLTLAWSAHLFGLANTLIGMVAALIIMAWRSGIWPFRKS